MELINCKSMDVKMKYYLVTILAAILIITASGCADLQTDINQPESIMIHNKDITNSSSPDFHGNLLKGKFWKMTECQSCHGPKYSGLTAPSCLTCHTSSFGPEACNTCHGSFTDPTRIAPPRSINNNSNTSDKGVGAHSKHLYDNTLGNQTSCFTCHNVPQSIYASGHFDTGLPAEVFLKELALANVANNAVYDPTAATCSNTYCHGNFVFYKNEAPAEDQFVFTADSMAGLNNTVDWTKVDGSQAACGSCHGLPPAGHIQVPLTACASCHGTVIDFNGNIIDKTRHINGIINVRQK